MYKNDFYFNLSGTPFNQVLQVCKTLFCIFVGYYFNYHYLAKPIFRYVSFFPQKWIPFFSIVVITGILLHLFLFLPFNLLRVAYVVSKCFFLRLRYLMENFSELSILYFIGFCFFFICIFILQFWLPKAAKHYFNIVGFIIWQRVVFSLSVISRKYGSVCFFAFLFFILIIETNFFSISSFIFT